MSKDRKAWTKEEDACLLAAHRRLGPLWTDIAKLLPGRTAHNMWNRFNRLQSKAEKSGGRTEWTKEEDASLLAAQLRLGRRWTDIAKLLPGRTDNDVRNRFDRLERKKQASAAAVMAQGNAAAGGADGGGGGAPRSAAATLAEQARASHLTPHTLTRPPTFPLPRRLRWRAVAGVANKAPARRSRRCRTRGAESMVTRRVIRRHGTRRRSTDRSRMSAADGYSTRPHLSSARDPRICLALSR